MSCDFQFGQFLYVNNESEVIRGVNLQFGSSLYYSTEQTVDQIKYPQPSPGQLII